MESKEEEQVIVTSKALSNTPAENAERRLGSTATSADKILFFLCLYAFAASPTRRPGSTAPAESSNGEDEKHKRLQFLLEKKLASLQLVATLCMSWWISSVAFCATILAAVWLQREQIVKSGILLPLGLILSVFFAGVFIFGVVMLRYRRRLREEMSKLAAGDEVNFSNELSTFRWAMAIGTGSFFFILLVWLFFWCLLSPRCQNFLPSL